MTVDVAGTMAELLLADRWNYEASNRARIYFSQDIPVAVQNHQLDCAGEPVFHSSSMCNDKATDGLLSVSLGFGSRAAHI